MALACLLSAQSGWSAEGGKDARAAQVQALLARYRLVEAKEALQGAPAAWRDGPVGRALQAQLAFYQGEYGRADELIGQALRQDVGNWEWRRLRDQVRLSQAVTARLRRADFDQEGLTVYHAERDGVLVPYLRRAVAAQRAVWAQVTSHIPRKVRVYVVDSLEDFAALCGLAAKQVVASGTVALTRYNRVMLLSPSQVAGGYAWLDTVAHEYSHLVITRIAGEAAPVWLQEGVAKLSEAWWRTGRNGALSPYAAYILDRAAAEGRWLPFARYHPSVVLLPSQEDVQLAYAQSVSFAAYLAARIRKEGGDAAEFAALLEETDQRGVQAAVRRLTGIPLRKLVRWWKQKQAGARASRTGTVVMSRRRFALGRAASDPVVFPRAVRNHVRVGDLLMGRGHAAAAVREYRWALEANGAVAPELAARLGKALLRVDRVEEARAAVEPAAELFPDHAEVVGLLGLAAHRLGASDAVGWLERAVGLDPYWTDIHCALAESAGLDAARRAQERRFCGR